MGANDIAYKEFFSDPQNVEDLLRGFVKKDYINELDYSTLERSNSDFVRKESGERHDDIIWRLKWKERWLYVYIIIEFQSNVDYSMPVRIMSYIAEMWLSLLENVNTEYHKNHTVPPVLPIVLYNGVENWNAVTNVADMLQDKSFSNINIDYYLIDELHPVEGQKDAVTEGILNCVTALIEVERSKNKKNLEEILHQLSIKLNTKEKLDKFRTFLRFLRRYVSAKFKKEIPNDFRNMEEAINMTRDFAAMERAEGIIEGANAREIAIVNRMLEKGKNIDEIADLCGIDLDTVLKYKADREKAVTN